MSQSLTDLMLPGGDTIFHSPEFLSFVHSHEAHLKAGSVMTPIDPGIVHKFEYNFMSLVVELGYPLENLIFFMVVNDFDCPTQMTKDFKQMRLPNVSTMGHLKSLYRQTSGRI